MTDAVTLVTGGTGFLGSHLVATLHQAGGPVRTCGRGPRPAGLPADVEYVRVDLVDDGSLAELVDGVGEVVHAAGAASSTSTPEQMEAVNVTGTEHLLQAAAKAGVARVVYVSTTSVYGKELALPPPVVEDAPCHPGAGYAASKWRAEQVAWRYAEEGLPVVVARPSTIFGPGAVKLVASTILDAAIERWVGLATFVVPNAPVEMRLVHVDDVVVACLHLARCDGVVGKAFNVDSGVYPPSHTIAAAVADALGLELVLTDDSAPGLAYEERQETREDMLAAGMRPDIILPKERIRYLNKANRNNQLSLTALAATGLTPQVTDIPAAVQASVRWYEQHGWVI